MVNKPLDIYTFGSQLIKTKDLDPVYVVLYEAQLENELLKRWLIAYFCFYHCGTASWISDVRLKDEGAYWERMVKAAGSKDYYRSSERRHFRGQQAMNSVLWLKERKVEGLFSYFTEATCGNHTLSVQEVMEYVMEWKGFGKWIAFKVADILERLGLVKVNFDGADKHIFESPTKGAEMLWANEMDDEEFIPDNVVEWAMTKVQNRLDRHKAPPRYERRINAQESETILCKWHSHCNGHYTVGKDIIEIEHGLRKFSSVSLAQRLLTAGKRGDLW